MGTQSHATAKVRRTGPTTWRFEYVDGDPVLRAVLFEALRIDPARAVLQRLFAEMGTDEIAIILRTSQSFETTASGRSREDIDITRGRVVIDKVLLPPAPGSGMALSDKDAERAKRRDRGALTRLRLSPAFMAPIRDRDPG
jgi:hypothetical protein